MIRSSYRSPARQLLLLFVAALLASAVVLIPATTAHAQGAGDWLGWVNNLRAANGLAGLELDGEQSALAQQRAATNAANGGLSHTSNLSAGVTTSWTKLGENVGMGADVASIGNAFRNSSAHLANLLDGRYTHIGIGITFRDGTMYVTHRFLAVSQGRSTPAPDPAPAPAPKPAAAPTPAPKSAPAPTTTTTAPPPPAPPAPEPVTTPPPAEPQRVATVLDALYQRSS